MLRKMWRAAFESVCLPAVFCAILLVGCGGGDEGPKLVPVSGVVTVDGAPLATANVSFRPDTSKGNTVPYEPGGAADGTGRFELTTTARKGAPVGWYKVVVFAPTPPRTSGDAPKVGPPPFNAKYSDAARTDLSIEVKAGAVAGAYDLKLTK